MSFQKAFSRYLQGTKYLGWSYRSIKLCSLKRIMQKFPSVIRFNIIKHLKKKLLLILSPSQTDSIRGRDLMMTDLKWIARTIYSREEITESWRNLNSFKSSISSSKITRKRPEYPQKQDPFSRIKYCRSLPLPVQAVTKIWLCQCQPPRVSLSNDAPEVTVPRKNKQHKLLSKTF